MYGRSSTPTARVGSGNRSKKQPFMLKLASGTPITTMSAEVAVADASINQGTVEVLLVEADPVAGSGGSPGEACKVCKEKHRISRCSVFPTRSLCRKQRFARSNALCYHCLSTSHVRKRGPKKNGCMEKDRTHVKSRKLKGMLIRVFLQGLTCLQTTQLWRTQSEVLCC